MKKSLFSLVIAAGAIVLLAGCSSTSVDTNRFGAQVSLNMKTVDFVPEITVGDQLVTGSSMSTVYCGFIRIGDTGKQVSGISFASGKSIWGGSDAYQRAALYDACIKSKADLILAPQYATTTEGHFFKKVVRCEVKGFPGFVNRVKIVPPCCPKAPCPKAPCPKAPCVPPPAPAPAK